jgi:hypothetical protein
VSKETCGISVKRDLRYPQVSKETEYRDKNVAVFFGCCIPFHLPGFSALQTEAVRLARNGRLLSPSPSPSLSDTHTGKHTHV